MQTTIQKWGNSLAVRIPSSFVRETGLKDGLPVDLEIENDTIVIRHSTKVVLKELLEKMNPGNLHEEVQTGELVGGEVW